MKDELKTKKLAVEKARVSVKRQRKALKVAPEDKKKIRARVLKTAKTRLANAEKAYKEAKKAEPKISIREKIGNAVNSITVTAKKIPVKKTFTYTGLAITTVATGFGLTALYSYMKKDSDDAVVHDAV